MSSHAAGEVLSIHVISPLNFCIEQSSITTAARFHHRDRPRHDARVVPAADAKPVSCILFMSTDCCGFAWTRGLTPRGAEGIPCHAGRTPRGVADGHDFPVPEG
jgi:hypothetical protein